MQAELPVFFKIKNLMPFDSCTIQCSSMFVTLRSIAVVKVRIMYAETSAAADIFAVAGSLLSSRERPRFVSCLVAVHFY